MKASSRSLCILDGPWYNWCNEEVICRSRFYDLDSRFSSDTTALYVLRRASLSTQAYSSKRWSPLPQLFPARSIHAGGDKKSWIPAHVPTYLYTSSNYSWLSSYSSLLGPECMLSYIGLLVACVECRGGGRAWKLCCMEWRGQCH